MSCNSGARIGLAEDVKALFKIAWEDRNNPEKGWKYLYLTEDDYRTIGDSVKTVALFDEGEKR